MADKPAVPRKSTKPAQKRPSEMHEPSRKPVGIVVRRGALRRFNTLLRETAELPAVVSWDRRQADRRGSSESDEDNRRKTDRRQTPPFTWDAGDFVVLDQPPEKVLPVRQPAESARAQSTTSKKRAFELP